MQRSENNQAVMGTHHKMRASTTLNRRYVKRPAKNDVVEVPIKRNTSKITHFHTPKLSEAKQEEAMQPATTHPIQENVNAKMKERRQTMQQATQKVTAQELKEQAIKKALMAAQITDNGAKEIKTKKAKKQGGIHFGFGQIMLALCSATAVVFAIAYFVNLNMPDISLKVAAMQTGIEASYPSYVPRDYGLTSITSEDGKITLDFKNGATDDAFRLTEEQSHWDSNALLTNYIKPTYEENYTVIREQGLTIYVNESNAAWVNGGIFYKIETTSGSLTKKQIRSIAVSL